MKKIFILSVAVCFSASCFSQGLWSQKATYPAATGSSSITFSIQSIGYMYTGDSTHNFFAYDPVANTWAAKADLPGPARQGATGFSTDSLGFIGTGQIHNSTAVNDVYRYDPASNTWAAIASYPDSVYQASAFGINNTGYIISGIISGSSTTLCYAYSPYTNQWTQIASIPFHMTSGVSTSVNSKGYCFNGTVDSIYQYDPIANSWSTPGAFAFGPNSSSFVINNKVYICYPSAFTGGHAGMRVYDVVGGSWSLINVFPYQAGCSSFDPYIGLSIGNKGYLGASADCIGNTFWQYDTAYYFAVTSVTPDTICQSDSFSVTISSNLSFTGSNYFRAVIYNSWGGGTNITDSVPGSSSGTYTFKLPPYPYLPANINATTVSVFSTNPAFQTGYDSISFIVKKNPDYLPLQASYWSCGGSAMLLYRANVGGQGYLWTSSPPGVHDSTYVLSFTPTIYATTIYTTDINLATGCRLYDSTVVYLPTHPSSNISDSIYAICAGTGLTIGGGVADTDCSYTWTGGGISSGSVDVTVTPSVSSTYHVLVKDTISGCSTGVNISVTVKQPPPQTICFVTVDTASTHNIVVWEKLDKYATDSFIIYRETSTNVYTEIASIPRDSLSEYHDYGANPNVTAYRYKIATLDTCANYGVLSLYHNTIHLQYLGTGNLIWNVYEIENTSITPVSSFDVYWDTLANGNWQVMINVPGNQYTATDINYTMHPNARYRIVANWSYSCTPSRSANNQVLSNIIRIPPAGINTPGPGQSISLYPNPAMNELMISCGTDQVEEVAILSADGKLVSSILHPVHNRLDISRLAEGIYIAEIKISNTIQRIKWVKM
jgi:hypothetical protein